MSDPAKKPARQPESYSPKAKPEIMKLAEQAEQQAREEALPQPTIVTKQFLLAGFEAPIELKDEHWPGMDFVKAALKASLGKFENPVRPMRFIGLWEADPKADYRKKKHHSRRLYFYGVEVTSLEGLPAGCVTKEFPEQTFAFFREREHGSPKYDWLAAAGFEADKRFMEKYALDMEIFDQVDDDGPEWDVGMPILAPESYRPKTKPTILNMAQEANQMKTITQPAAKAAPATIRMKVRNAVRIIELPACKMVSSGRSPWDKAFGPDGPLSRFDEWMTAFSQTCTERLLISDLMWGPTSGAWVEWAYAVAEIPDDMDGFEVIDFPGGLFAVAISVDADGRDHDRVHRGIQKWVKKSGCFALDETDQRFCMGTITSPQCTKNVMGYEQMDLYFPIRIKEAQEQ